MAQTEANLARLVTSKRVAVQSAFGQKRTDLPRLYMPHDEALNALGKQGLFNSYGGLELALCGWPSDGDQYGSVEAPGLSKMIATLCSARVTAT